MSNCAIRVLTLATCVAIVMQVGTACTPPQSVETDAERASSSSAAEPAVPPIDVAALSDVELADRITRLREIVHPPEGTPRAAVDRVFGAARVQERSSRKGNASAYPMHIYTLLPPRDRQEFRVFLGVTYRDDLATRVFVNHTAVAKGREVGRDTEELRRDLRVEQERVLVDLEEIRARYRVELDSAPWAPAERSPALPDSDD